MRSRALIRTSELCAVNVLLRQSGLSIYSMSHLDVRRLETGFDVKYDTFEGYFSKIGVQIPHELPDGLTMPYKNGYIVLCKEDGASEHRRIFSYAHELGHIVMGHSERSKVAEREANAFAASLLMPAAAIRYLASLKDGKITAELIESNFNVSHAAAEVRAAELTRRERASAALRESEMALLFKLFGKVCVNDATNQI